MKKLVLLTVLMFMFGHCTFQSSNANTPSSSLRIETTRKYIDGMTYLFAIDGYNYGGVTVVNITNDKLMKKKLELEIKVLEKELKNR